MVFNHIILDIKKHQPENQQKDWCFLIRFYSFVAVRVCETERRLSLRCTQFSTTHIYIIAY
nr:MAG TPA: hypothetical protein [Caudoviricetes sp.]